MSAATVATASAVEATPASAMEATACATTAVEAASAAEPTAAKLSASEAAAEATATIKAAPVAAVAAASEAAAVPWPRANKDTAVEPIWTVVTIRCAGVRIIRIVAVGAHWSWTVVARTVSISEAKPNLRVCMRYCEQADTRQSKKS